MKPSDEKRRSLLLKHPEGEEVEWPFHV